MRQTAARNPQYVSSDHPYVVRTEGVCGGRPRLKGSRIPVSTIAEYVRSGESPAGIAALYPHVEPAAIQNAIGYYLEHENQIDAEIEANSLESVLAETGAALGAAGVIRLKKAGFVD
jgi:uncharacterized protein (DUF433 family)